jgi:FemAB-related protein (PEP-CTERM system-associated)
MNFQLSIPVSIELCSKKDKNSWNDFVLKNKNSNLYHFFEWKQIIEKTYGHKTYYLKAVDNNGKIRGILPLAYLKSLIFGKKLISLPYFDIGGILADNIETEKKLLEFSIELFKKLKADCLEIREKKESEYLKEAIFNKYKFEKKEYFIKNTSSDKARMVLNLPQKSTYLFNSYKSKFKNDIKKPFRENLKFKIGGKELLDDFYSIFSVNMRDLGSPVHSKSLFENILELFNEKARIGIVYQEKKALACIFTIGHKKTLSNPWASSLKEYRHLNTNIFQYWKMLEYACLNGYELFDFGRSAPLDNTFKFKKKWGAKPEKLFWYNFSMENSSLESEKSKFGGMVKYWQKIPVSVTQIAGPQIRKNIGL